MADIEHRVLDIIRKEMGVAPERILPESRLDGLGDSLDWLSLLCAVEAEFDIEITSEQSESLDTVGDLIRFVQPHAAHA